MTDLRDHPFSPENVSRESGEWVSRTERAYDQWLATAEKLIGHSLDGNDWAGSSAPIDGYSLDEAFDMFRAGRSPQAYVTMVATRTRYRNPNEAA